MTATRRPLRILISGSRRWTDQAFIALAMAAWIEEQGFTIGSVWPVPVVVHGGAHGADSLAGRVARNWGWREQVRPNMDEIPPAHVMLAFPAGESPGTRARMDLADAAGIPVVDCAAAVQR